MRDDQGGKRLRQNKKANQKVGRRRRMLLASDTLRIAKGITDRIETCSCSEQGG